MPGPLSFNNPVPDSPSHELAKRTETEFAHDRTAMGFHGLYTEREVACTALPCRSGASERVTRTR
jgi:hypothetical protein